MLEQLYQREIVEKPIEKQNLRLEVAQLMEKMYEEQQSKITKRESETIQESTSESQNYCRDSLSLKQKSTMIGYAFMKVWVKYHENEIDDTGLELEVCSILEKSESWGKSVQLVANMIKQHLEFLLDIKINCKSTYDSTASLI